MAEHLRIRLFDPGMSPVHRVGLAGLYMALKYFQSTGQAFGGGWRLSKNNVELFWNGETGQFFDSLFRASFGISDGLVDLAAHRGHAMGDIEKIAFSEAMRMTFLQHNKQHRIPGGTADRVRNFDFGDEMALISYKPFSVPYAHATASERFLDTKGRLRDSIKIKNWLYPGAAERHSNLSGTEIEETPARFICLLYAPMASLFFRLNHRGPDGKRDARRGTAIVFPHINDLESYAHCFGRYLQTPVQRLSADGVGDAAMAALVALKAEDSLETLGVAGCTVVTMGSVGWVSNQRTRTGVATLEEVSEGGLDLFDRAWRCLPNRMVIMEGKPTKKNPKPDKTFFVATSLPRGLIAENIASGKAWFSGFASLMESKKQADIVSFEKGGLARMVEDQEVLREGPERAFVLACHEAWRRRMAQIGEKARRERSSFQDQVNREFTRLRVAFSRSKNAASLREVVADFWARGGPTKPLQAGWRDVLDLLDERNWRKAKDLALLALASYKPETKEEAEALETSEVNNKEGEE